MTKQISSILKPGIGVDLIFNLSSMSPLVKPSIIFEQDNNKIVVAQPQRKISSEYKFETMHISSLISNELSVKIRKGYLCRIIKLIDKYKLANDNRTQALLLELQEPLLEMNIRAAFRFKPNLTHNVIGKIVYEGKEFYSGVHFKVFDISISGIGFLIPKKIKKNRNPLLDISKNSPANVGLLLKSTEDKEEILTLESEIFIVRTNIEHNERSGFAGVSFQNLLQQSEEALNKFIHNAQLFEIRKNNRL